MMTDQTTYERALARADREGCHIILDYGNRWVVTGSDGLTVYAVTEPAPESFACTCPARGYCKHIAKVEEKLAHEQQAREAALAEAMAEVYAQEQAERSAAIQAWNDAAVAETEAALAAQPFTGYDVVGAALAIFNAEVERTAQWERYQDARRNGAL